MNFDGKIDVYIIERVEGLNNWDTNHCLDHKASPSRRADSNLLILCFIDYWHSLTQNSESERLRAGQKHKFSPEISIEFCLWKLFLLELILSFSECTKLLLRNLCIDSVRGEYKFGWDNPVWESWVGIVNWFPKSGWGTVNWLTWGPYVGW